ncbi:Tetratricopeptide repeat-containing protein [Bradyrhizobium lablabi]|uniref:Tetratricopeptide repeat-containing protein n=1 Tax=Bradyrhizobium lablabi TaxID=722472 RepID=A0A1M6PHW9_9BRAD|nr:tetratricopeptide repeat protein [Bradyrhizobium lablabi]SHK07538.1 Tetratricopeptide repeat-containing protein [Bradyrhizobium lablabi]
MRFRKCLLPALLLTAALASLVPTVAVAQLNQERNWCAGKAGVTPELRIDSCTAVLQAGPQSSKQLAFTYRERGLAYFSRRDYERAIQDYDQAINLDSRYSDAFDNRCWTRMITDKLDDALKDCKESLRLRPGSAPTLNSLGFVYLKQGKLDDAIATYNAALQINPKSAYSLYGRGMAKLRKGDAAAGKADIAASKAIKDLTEEMNGYGVK